MLLLNHLEYNIVILIIIYLKLQTVPLSQSIDPAIIINFLIIFYIVSKAKKKGGKR